MPPVRTPWDIAVSDSATRGSTTARPSPSRRSFPTQVTNSTGLFFNGVVPGPQPLPQNGTFVNINDSGIDFQLGGQDQAGPHTFQVTISYDSSTQVLHERIEDTTTHAVFTHDYNGVDLPAQVGGNTAFVGFGSGTDSRWSNNDIVSWTYNNGSTTTIDHANGFASQSDVTLNGDAKVVDSDAANNPVVRLVGHYFDSAGSVFADNKVDITNFTTTFQFQMGSVGVPVGDGISFIIQGAQGQQQGGRNYGDTMLRLSPTQGTMTVSDFFTPESPTPQHLAIKDLDFGTSSTIALPDMPGTAHPHLAVELAKNGDLYLVDRDNMGHLSQPLQQFAVNPVPSTSRLQAVGLWGAMSFHNNTLYVHAADDVLKAFHFNPTTQQFDTTPVNMTSLPAVNFPGDSTSVSSNNGANAIVWDLETDGFMTHSPAILHAYDATNLNQLYNSANNSSDKAGPAIKFTVPTVAGGKVFVGTSGELDVYGLLSQKPMPPEQSVSNDFNGDGQTDLSVFRPSNGQWYITSVGGPVIVNGQQWGLPGDIPIPADYNGDGKTDMAVFRPSNGQWYVATIDGQVLMNGQQWGLSGDIPETGDFNNDGKTDMAVFRPSNGQWYIRSFAGQVLMNGQQWGLPGDKPEVGNFNGNGGTDLAVFRPSNGQWYIRSFDGQVLMNGQQWGLSGDIPETADFNNDGSTDLAVFRPSNGQWYIRTFSGNVLLSGVQWGLQGDIPSTGDFNGDHKADLAVFRPSNGQWYVTAVGGPVLVNGVQWGLSGDIPTTATSAQISRMVHESNSSPFDPSSQTTKAAFDEGTPSLTPVAPGPGSLRHFVFQQGRRNRWGVMPMGI